ncbi:S26 family signal peptidase [Dietzia aurantiaca]|uniref:S26 family signal peptidase n=1 Tax=Dietzia aurantiaca TaxID=983873 RepID=UPI001E39F17E|nr:S26 family signal peptidase [Dietzia aurantiaca]
MMQAESGQSQESSRSRAREWALNIGAIVGSICIVAAALSMFLGIKPLVFQSGSMSPSITTGALALARTVPAQQLEVGDVVSMTNPSGVRVTHRVTALDPFEDGEVSITMRGDANAADDPMPYSIGEADRVFFHINGLGYAVAWLSSPVAIFLGGMLAGGLGVIAFGRTREATPVQADSGDDFATIGAVPREIEEACHE